MRVHAERTTGTSSERSRRMLATVSVRATRLTTWRTDHWTKAVVGHFVALRTRCTAVHAVAECATVRRVAIVVRSARMVHLRVVRVVVMSLRVRVATVDGTAKVGVSATWVATAHTTTAAATTSASVVTTALTTAKAHVASTSVASTAVTTAKVMVMMTAHLLSLKLGLDALAVRRVANHRQDRLDVFDEHHTLGGLGIVERRLDDIVGKRVAEELFQAVAVEQLADENLAKLRVSDTDALFDDVGRELLN